MDYQLLATNRKTYKGADAKTIFHQMTMAALGAYFLSLF